MGMGVRGKGVGKRELGKGSWEKGSWEKGVGKGNKTEEISNRERVHE